MMRNQDALDELIFDYLEGNLSKEESEAFEILLKDNSELRDKVGIWRHTFIDMPLPITEQLEQRIITKHKKSSFSFLLNSLLILCVLIFFNGNLLNEESLESSKEMIPEHQAEEIKMPCEEVALKEVEDDLIKRPLVEERNNSSTIPLIEAIRQLKPVKMNDVIPLDYFLKTEIKFEGIIARLNANVERENTNDDIKNKSRIDQRTSRFEKRAINRKKRRDAERQSELKFIKGRVPYVVPLDITNF